MEMENAAFRAYLEEHGYDLSLIGAIINDVDPEQLNVGTGGKAVLHDKTGAETTVSAGPLYEAK
jgi:hypothetical protein